jgi:SPP1 gp7 family putative phage head morphogenesis protein
MPLQQCQSNNKTGWKWGTSGKCFVGNNARQMAVAQGRAIKASQPRNDSAEDKQRAVRQQRQILKAVGVQLPSKNKKVPKQRGTVALEIDYFKEIMKLVTPFFEIVREVLTPSIPDLVAKHKQEIRFDQSFGEDLTKNFNDIEFQVGRIVTDDRVTETAANAGTKTSNVQRQQLAKQFRSVLGINPLLSEPYLQAQLANFTTDNVALIKSIPAQSLQRIETSLRVQIEQGVSTRDITKALSNEFKIARNRAKLIARDQIGKFYGSLNGLRQQETGITHYFWQTSEDERVRPALGLKVKSALNVISHRRLNKKRFAWGKPPVSGTRGERLPPGQPISCRCQAIPDFSPFLFGLG